MKNKGKKHLLLWFALAIFILPNLLYALDFSGFADLRIAPDQTIKPFVEQFEIDLSHNYFDRAEFNGAIAWDRNAINLAVASINYKINDNFSLILGQVDVPFTLSSTQYGSPDNPTPSLPITNSKTVDGLNDKLIALEMHSEAISLYSYIIDENSFGSNLYLTLTDNSSMWFSYLRLNSEHILGFSADIQLKKILIQGEMCAKTVNAFGSFVYIRYKILPKLGLSIKPEFWSENNNIEYYISSDITFFATEDLLFRIGYKYNKGPIVQVLATF